MDVKLDGENLLKVHSNLYSSLIEIPDKREIEFREEFDDGKWFGKPRFKKSQYEWEEQLFKDLRDHLEEIWNFFKKYNYWFDDTILVLIESDTRRTSKKSIIFLLENDIWNTSEVYGKYLIERGVVQTAVSYYRFDTRINPRVLDSVDDTEIKKWICKDAITQVKNQLSFFWLKLETEIKVCMEEEHVKKPRVYLTSDYLKKQLDLTMELSKEWPEASLLCLGRICELWVLKLLGRKHKPPREDIILKSIMSKIINQHQGQLLYKIKRHYNNLKHKTYYHTDSNFVGQLIEQLSNLISSTS